jgi:hypothetical protein
MSSITALNPSHAPAIYSKHPSFGWSEDHECVGIENFDFDKVCQNLDGEEPPVPADDRRRDAGEALHAILSWVCRPKPLRSKLVRFIGMMAALRPDLLDDRSYLQIGRELHITKAAVCKMVMVFERETGFKSLRTRPAEGRANMRRSRLRQLSNGPGRHKPLFR